MAVDHLKANSVCGSGSGFTGCGGRIGDEPHKAARVPMAIWRHGYLRRSEDPGDLHGECGETHLGRLFLPHP